MGLCMYKYPRQLGCCVGWSYLPRSLLAKADRDEISQLGPELMSRAEAHIPRGGAVSRNDGDGQLVLVGGIKTRSQKHVFRGHGD